MYQHFFDAIKKHLLPLVQPFGIDTLKEIGPLGMGYCYAQLNKNNKCVLEICLERGNAVFIFGGKETNRPVDIGYLLPDKNGVFGIRWLYESEERTLRSKTPDFVEWQVKRLAELLEPPFVDGFGATFRFSQTLAMSILTPQTRAAHLLSSAHVRRKPHPIPLSRPFSSAQRQAAGLF